jgi:hypothetical protein
MLDLRVDNGSKTCPQMLWISLWMLWGKVTQVSVSLTGFSSWSSFDRPELRRANKDLGRNASCTKDMRQSHDGPQLTRVSNLCCVTPNHDQSIMMS